MPLGLLNNLQLLYIYIYIYMLISFVFMLLASIFCLRLLFMLFVVPWGLRELFTPIMNLANLTQWTSFLHPWDLPVLVFGRKTYIPSRNLVHWRLRDIFAQLGILLFSRSGQISFVIGIYSP